MTKRETMTTEALLKQTLEATERLLYKNADDMAISIARSLERMEERIDAMESRLHSRLAELADQVTESKCSPAAR